MNIAYPVISDVHETTSLTGKLLNTHVASATQPYLPSISSKELPPTTLVNLFIFNCFYKLTTDFLAFINGFYAIATLKSKETVIAFRDTPSSCEQALIRATKMCCTMYYSTFLHFLMQFDSIIWHSTSHMQFSYLHL